MSMRATPEAVTTPHPHDPDLEIEDIAGCRNSILWSLRTLQVAVSVFDMPYEGFAADVKADDDYAADLVELFKAVELDKRYTERRAKIADRVLARISAALAARHDGATETALRQPIKVERLPTMPSIPARYMNTQRPGLPWPND